MSRKLIDRALRVGEAGQFRKFQKQVERINAIEPEMEEELRSHIQHRADDLERSGLDRAESVRRARRVRRICAVQGTKARLDGRHLL